MTVSSKIRIYDLAKELKLDTKRLIKEVRSAGVDVSVPSNSISKGLAETIRIKYFPKTEAIAKPAIRAAKKAKGPLRIESVVIEPKKTPNGNQKERAIVCICETCGAIALSKSKLNTHSLNAHGKSQRKTFTTKLHSPAQRCRDCGEKLREKEKKSYGGFCYACYCVRHQHRARYGSGWQSRLAEETHCADRQVPRRENFETAIALSSMGLCGMDSSEAADQLILVARRLLEQLKGELAEHCADDGGNNQRSLNSSSMRSMRLAG